ncbi:MAG: TatD family hydrolase [Pseudomonadota bacterium]
MPKSKSKRSRPKPEIPRFDHPIFETHCHLDYLPQEELEAVLTRARAVGVDKIVTIAVAPTNLDTVLELARSHDQLWCTQGVHPHEAEQFSAATDAAIRSGAEAPEVVAIGEIGLDYYYDHADRAVQCRVFETQLAIAVELDLPIVVHTRDADADTQAILSNFAGDLRRKGVIHSFTSGVALAEYCLGEGFCLGFNGIATFNKAQNVRDVIAATPLEQLVIETDAPYLTPVPYRGTPNAPYFLPFIARYLADFLELPVERFLEAVYRNSERLFFASAPSR